MSGERRRERLARRRLLAGVGTAGLVGVAGCEAVRDRLGSGSGCPAYDPVPASNRSWPGRSGPPDGSGRVADGAAPGIDLSRDWAAPFGSRVGASTPAVAGGTAYVHDLDGVVRAFDAATGEARWAAALSEPRATPAVGGGTTVVRHQGGTSGFDAATGERLWDVPGPRPELFGAAPVVRDGTAYLRRGVDLRAVAVADGRERWRRATGLRSPSTPAVADGTVHAAGGDAYVYALDAADGTERWRRKTDAVVRSNVAVADGTVHVGTADGDVLALDAGDGRVRWRTRLRGPVDDPGPPRPLRMAADGARVYVATDDPDERLYALDAAGGEECWTEGTYRADPTGGVAVAGGRVYLPASRETDLAAGTLAVLDAATGERLADRPLDRPARGPAVADGALFVATRATGGLRLVRFD